VKLLLDENVPAPITSTVKTLLRRSHDVQHVIDMTLRAIDPGRDRRYGVCDPETDPPKFWPQLAA
jgi:hypothetical protein